MQNVKQFAKPSLVAGFGLGLRTAHCQDFVTAKQRVDWLEIMSEDYRVEEGQPLHDLDRIRRDYPMVMHGVSLSIGSTDPVDPDYLRGLQRLAQRVQPAWISDHLGGAGADRLTTHAPLPLPYTRQTLRHICRQIGQVQDFLGRSLVVENPAPCVKLQQDEMSEWGFIREMVQISGCELLLDMNNIHASSATRGFDPHIFIDAMPAGSVRQIHLAGHENPGQAVADPVWGLYAYALQRLGMVPTMVEPDDPLPPLSTLIRALDCARSVARLVLSAPAPEWAAA